MAGSVALAASSASTTLAPEPESIWVNDIHSQLNPTQVLGISQPRPREDVQSLVRAARKDRKAISVAGGRHAMGGQQFGTDTQLIDIRKMSRITWVHVNARRMPCPPTPLCQTRVISTRVNQLRFVDRLLLAKITKNTNFVANRIGSYLTGYVMISHNSVLS